MQNLSPLVIFLPPTGIGSFLRPLATIATAAQKYGHEVCVTACNGNMPYCTYMAMHTLPPNMPIEAKRPYCQRCRKNLLEAATTFGFSILELSGLHDVGAENFDFSKLACVDDVLALQYGGFRVGAAAACDFMLHTKSKLENIKTQEHFDLLLAYLRNTVVAVGYGLEICKKMRPAMAIVYNWYADCQAFKFVCNQYNIRCFITTIATHKGFDGSLIRIADSVLDGRRHLHNWDNVHETPIHPEHVEGCWDDVLFRSYGANSHIYSPNKELDIQYLCGVLNIDLQKKVCVVYTSSMDEQYSEDFTSQIWGEAQALEYAFKDQLEWLHLLRNYARIHPEIQFIIRVHPREGNSKTCGNSPHLLELQQHFSQNTQNFKMVWPADPISSYDLMEIAHLALIAWSSMGMEVSRVGLPVLSWVGKHNYPDSEFVRIAKNPEQYIKILGELLEVHDNMATLIKAIRYYHWRTFVSFFDLSETVPHDCYQSYWAKVPESKAEDVYNVLCGNANIYTYTVQNWQSALHSKSIEDEYNAVLQGIKAYIHATFNVLIYLNSKRTVSSAQIAPPKVKDFAQRRLEVGSDFSEVLSAKQATLEDPSLAILLSKNDVLLYVYKGDVTRHFSRLLRRLKDCLVSHELQNEMDVYND